MYDIIGDIHGYADELEALLKKMGYEDHSGCYRHPERTAIFVGDLIDRGPKIREVLDIVRPMVESEAALIVMGNHEFNALAYHTSDPDSEGQFLREHSDKNTHQHQATLDQVGSDIQSIVDFFYTMPLWLELPNLRVVHACWDPQSIACLDQELTDRRLNQELLIEASRDGSPTFKAVETVLKGKEWSLGQASFKDKDGNERHEARVRWYLPYEGQPISEYCFPVGVELPSGSFEPETQEPGYHADEKPVFFGHYWLRASSPQLEASNVCCLDYSVAKKGFLCAYRIDEAETRLSESNFIWV
ncbi:hypothetical protein EBR25_14020 [bacterium]|nr:hypothetical protein [bacterium]